MNPEKMMPSFDAENMPNSDELEAQKNMEELMRIGEDLHAEGGGAESGVDIAKEANKEKNLISRKDLPINAQVAVEMAEKQILDDINIKSEEQRAEIKKELNLRWFSNYRFMNNKLMQWSGKAKVKDSGRRLYEDIRGEAEELLKKKIKGIEFKEN